MSIHLLVPGPLDTVSGGNIYDRRMVEGLRALGETVDRVAAWCGLYQHAWHPTMLRVSLFVCLYGAVALYIYR